MSDLTRSAGVRYFQQRQRDLQQKARRMALAWVNEQRERAGFGPLKRLPPLWWAKYGREWVTKAK